MIITLYKFLSHESCCSNLATCYLYNQASPVTDTTLMQQVKHMNQMMLYSKIVTIRDAQIQEKRRGCRHPQKLT